MPRRRKVYRLICDGRFVTEGTLYELSELTGRSVCQLREDKKQSNVNRGRIIAVNLGDGEFALYRGEEMIAMGTAQELAELQNVKAETIRFYSSPVYAKRAAKKRVYQLFEIGEEYE